MKFIYACDIHGDTNKYEKLLKTAQKEKIKYIVLGGDLFPKRGIRTIIQPEFIKDFLEDYFKKLQENNIKCILIPGNDDLEKFDTQLNELCKKYPNIHNIDNKKLDIEDVSFIGLSKVLDHPFGSKNRVLIEKNLKMEPQLSKEIYINQNTEVITISEWEKYRETNIDKMEDILANLPVADKNKKTIYVLHDPPYGIGLDVCANGLQVGSKAIAEFLEKSNSYMSLHGHIHESPRTSGLWYNKLGKTICIQPGQTESGEKECYFVIIDTQTDKKDRYEIWNKIYKQI